MDKKLLVIYPKDITTNFLSSVLDFLNNSLPKQIVIKIIEPNKKSHEDCLELLFARNFDILLFLGHGSSQGVQGARDDNYKHDFLLTTKELPMLEEKSLIFFSCNSNDFLKKSNTYYIGFGDMPTDWNDITAARELDSGYYKGMSEETLSLYRESITHIIMEPVRNLTLKKNYGIKECYFDIKLRINKIIAESYKDHNRTELAYLMYDLKKDLSVRYQ